MANNQDATQVIAAQNSRFYLADYDEDNEIPADTVLFDTGFADPWVDKGLTRNGPRFSINTTEQDIEADQRFDPIFILRTARDLRAGADLMQMTAQNIQQAGGLGSISSLAATDTVRGHDILTIGDSVPIIQYSVAIDLQNRDNERFTIFGWNGFPVSHPSLTFSKNQAATLPVDLRLTPDLLNDGRVASVVDISPIDPDA